MGFISEFRDFAMRGNVVDMAVGIVIGGAFGKIVSSLVGDIIMPVVGAITGGTDFSKLKYVFQEAVPAVVNAEGETITAAIAEGAIRYGVFINAIIDFIIIAFAIFVVIKMMNNAKKRFEKQKIEEPEKAPEPSAEEKLLMEIRDAIKAKG
ncbi:MAG: large-conductance mechanosensitive channel protein MscL [Phycisphaerales bacterium]